MNKLLLVTLAVLSILAFNTLRPVQKSIALPFTPDPDPTARSDR